MIQFREKSYGDNNVTSNVVKAAGTGSSIGWALHKIGKNLFKEVTKDKIIHGWENAGKIISEEAYNKLSSVDKKAYKHVYTTGKETLKNSAQVFGESMAKKAESTEKFLAKFGTVGEWLKGVNRSFWDRLSKMGKWILQNPTEASLIGAAIGASIAIGYYLIKASYNKVDQKLIGFKGRMIDKVCEALTSMGYKKDIDFTTSPSQADYIKTRVCLVVSSTRDELNITINSVNDSKLEPIARQIIKNLPSGSKFYQRQSDKSNELTLAVTHTNNGDHIYIASIAERFIKKKYPVFIVEIN